MKLNIDQVKEIANKNMRTLEKDYFVKSLGVFGSVAIRENTESSDIDMLVEFSKPVGLFKFIKLEDYLSNLMGKNVDLVTKNALKPMIKEEILQNTIYV